MRAVLLFLALVLPKLDANLHLPCGSLVILSTPQMDVYRPQGGCVYIQSGLDPMAGYPAHFKGSALLRTDPGARWNCNVLTYTTAEGATFNFSSSAGLLQQCDAGQHCPSPVRSPANVMRLSLDGGRRPDLGPQLHCVAEPSPCGMCSSAEPIQIKIDPLQQPSLRLNSPSSPRHTGMPSACACHYRIDTAPGHVVRARIEAEGVAISATGECQGRFELDNSTGVVDRALELRLQSPQSGYAFFRLFLSISNVTRDLVCPATGGSSTPTTPLTAPTDGELQLPVWAAAVAGVGLSLLGLAIGALVGVKWAQRSPARKQPPSLATEMTTSSSCTHQVDNPPQTEVRVQDS